jgi:hypothetical protein
MLKETLKDDGENIIFMGSKLEMYIPMSYFETKLAENYGTSINVFGLFNVRVFDNKDKPGKLETLNLPTMICIYPIDGEVKELQLIEGEHGDPEQYYIAKFYTGNKVMSNSIQQNASNVELFLDIIFRGKIPQTIPYNQVLSIWHKNLELNGVKLGVTSTILEICISQIYRNKKKPEETFAKVMGKDPTQSEFSYKTANIREICARNSTFAAMTFEDMDSMITSSLNINKQNKQETESPIEKIIKM